MLCKNSLEMNIYNDKTFNKRVTSVMCIIRINDMLCNLGLETNIDIFSLLTCFIQ